jgi:Niemann-Pick C1 protein
LGTVTKEEQIHGELFERYLTWFLMDNPHEDCAKGGHAAYSLGVTYKQNMSNGFAQASASNFMTYHSILKTSRDYTEAMREARNLAENMTATLRSRKSSKRKDFIHYTYL